MTTLNQNQFEFLPLLGSLDLHFNSEVLSVEIDPTASGETYVAGQAVVVMDSTSLIPQVQAASANTESIFGFIVFDRMHPSFTNGSRCEIAQAGSVIHLTASGAVARGEEVTIVYSTAGVVQAATGTDTIVGYALDKAANGDVFRVKLTAPSFKAHS